ncbi:hypothetical protein HELRODRAFT_174781 [Helobdella robusta]|uniref:Myb-like domain-containing protein n=1 Tax=Helobdella robusta TaxID=6412 RepID=T1F8G8_HELRO|nr:hypothetical protein HELRODRAFT_174781 [Helobdella robusta]ESO01235.1 hypothetical protein HELRODRAFT_174781 [Helobdella robusta]
MPDIKRLKIFKSANTSSSVYWKKILDDLKKKGIPFSTGYFTDKENEQLKKNWKNVIESCPFEDPLVLLGKRVNGLDSKELHNYIKSINFYILLGHKINRSPYSVYARARKLFIKADKTGRYTKEEISLLQKLEAEYGNKWEKIGELMGRTGRSLLVKSAKIRKDPANGKWSEDETNLLITSVNRYYQERLADYYKDKDALMKSLKKNNNNNNNNGQSDADDDGGVNEEKDEEEREKRLKLIERLALDTKFLYYNLPWSQIAEEIPKRNAKQLAQSGLSATVIYRTGKDENFNDNKNNKYKNKTINNDNNNSINNNNRDDEEEEEEEEERDIKIRATQADYRYFNLHDRIKLIDLLA